MNPSHVLAETGNIRSAPRRDTAARLEAYFATVSGPSTGINSEPREGRVRIESENAHPLPADLMPQDNRQAYLSSPDGPRSTALPRTAQSYGGNVSVRRPPGGQAASGAAPKVGGAVATGTQATWRVCVMLGVSFAVLTGLCPVSGSVCACTWPSPSNSFWACYQACPVMCLLLDRRQCTSPQLQRYPPLSATTKPSSETRVSGYDPPHAPEEDAISSFDDDDQESGKISKGRPHKGQQGIDAGWDRAGRTGSSSSGAPRSAPGRSVRRM
jgi:hypothetical protein